MLEPENNNNLGVVDEVEAENGRRHAHDLAQGLHRFQIAKVDEEAAADGVREVIGGGVGVGYVRHDPGRDGERSRKISRISAARHADGAGGPGGGDRSRKVSTISLGPYATYVYDTRYAKTLGQLTREALPKLDHYRDGADFMPARPTLDELHGAGGDKARIQDEEAAADEPTEALKGKVIKFGWLEGVLMRCLLNIWGVMLFLRLSWVIGQAGMIQGFLVISLANVVTFVTGISMSAVATNGLIKGGGIYYMISRSLGPEFGAAIGLMFTVANSIAVSMYIVGFCESLNDLLKDNGVEGGLIDGGENDIRAIGVGILVLILILAFVGMDWVTRTQMFLLVVLLAAQLVFIIGTFMGPQNDEERAKGFKGYNYQTFKDNLGPDYRTGLGEGDNSEQSFFSVFGVFFPAVTGIVAGANLSGDLKDPSSAIPKGTLLAIGITYVSYIGYAFMMGGCVEREASGNVTQYRESLEWMDAPEGVLPPSDFMGYQDCVSETGENLCKYGLLNSAQVMELVSIFGYLIYAGCFAATLSSAIASLVGAPRVLQALAADKLYPKIEFFAVGYGANKDPVRGYILVFVISLGCLLIAKLNAIAPLLSNFFLAAYCLINFSVFHAEISKSPGWRPSFKYYNAWVSLFGAILCVVVMFLLSWITALITVGVSLVLYMYVWYRKPDVNWGSSTQAQSFNSAVASMQSLNHIHDHVKNYRPKILILSGLPGNRPTLVDFSYLLIKDISFMICGLVTAENERAQTAAIQQEGQGWLLKHARKGFFTLVEEETFTRGARSLMQLAGLGKLRPNMVMLGYKKDWTQNHGELMEYFNVMHIALDMHLALGILRVPLPSPDQGPVHDNLHASVTQFGRKQPKGSTIDVWWLYDDGGLTLLLPYILSTRSIYAGCKLRVFTISTKGNAHEDFERNLKSMTELLAKFRIQCSEVVIVPDITKKAADATRKEFEGLIEPFRNQQGPPLSLSDDDEEGGCELRLQITDQELQANKERTNRHLRYAEALREHSKEAALVVMTLPVPRRGAHAYPVKGSPKSVPAPLYMAWLEIMSRGMPPFLFARGNQTSVLTFYS